MDKSQTDVAAIIPAYNEEQIGHQRYLSLKREITIIHNHSQ